MVNKELYLALVFFIGLSCVNQGKIDECDIMNKVIGETLENDFFKNYRENEKLHIVFNHKSTFLRFESCLDNRNLLLDTLIISKRYIRIEEYRNNDGKIRIQLGCYDKTREPFNIMYSTSYFLENNNIRLNEFSSPYIDTLQIKYRN
ncbi:hypothetical protein [Nonlabens ulvanivorans]|uniref:Lipoprotein n=1 Tax=Nonlabens ulvanivorans TaxID=906888 RepID=A0A084JZG2_NONUL|nr:hypothetical protein [Nonlabens ulvanivorans]KEZ94346.1 hypothetical protein IL45_01625 [Nonlabens ulvanivorans]PRX12235.1 hypothetical protein LY02_02645 [Nonlabens ulvanivorans]